MLSRSTASRRFAPWFVLAGVVSVVVMVGAAKQRRPAGANSPQIDSGRPPGLPRNALPDAVVLNTHEIEEVRVVTVARGLSHPWGILFSCLG